MGTEIGGFAPYSHANLLLFKLLVSGYETGFIPKTYYSEYTLFYESKGDEYIISLDPPPAPHPQPRTHRAAAYRALAHEPQPREPMPIGLQPRELQPR